MLNHLSIVVWLSVGLYCLFLAKRQPMPLRRLLLAVLVIFITAPVMGYESYQSHLKSVELEEISAALDAIHVQDATGRKLTPDEIGARSHTLATLSERLAALRRQ